MERHTPWQDLLHGIESREVDTVLIGAPDMHGRLAGKRIAAERLLREREWGISAPLLKPDLDCSPIGAQQGAQSAQGVNLLRLQADMESARRIPWLPASALLLCDIADAGGALVSYAPRAMLRRQQQRLECLGVRARFATRLDFYVFEDDYDSARAKAYDKITRAGVCGQAGNLLESGRQESLLRAVRTHLAAARVPVLESAGMPGAGQHEVALAEDAPLAAADAHVLLKHGIKELAMLHERAVTFMAQWSDAHPGSGCIISARLRQQDDTNPPAAEEARAGAGELPQLCRFWLGGQLRLAREMSLFFAPFANSWRRLAAGGENFRQPVWRRDDCSAPLRVVGCGDALCLEWEWGGADVHPHLALAAIIAAGVHGIEERIEPPPSGEILADAARFSLPRSLEEAMAALEQSGVLRAAFGAEVIEHHLRAARWEAQRQPADESSSGAESLAWQRRRGFEQA